MTSPKRPRENASVPETSSTARTLPADLILEIVARSDLGALVRCAAASKLLRRDILSPDFIRRVSHHQGAAPCILVHLYKYANRPLALVHPVARGAASFFHDHLSPFIARSAAGLFEEYYVLTSRHGLVLLRRRNRAIKEQPRSDGMLCVYNPMNGARTFLSEPPEMHNTTDEYVLLTAADGIDRSFLLLVTDQDDTLSIKVQTASSPCGTWGPVMDVGGGRDHPGWPLKNPAVLQGGLIHWLDYQHKQIVSYDVGTGKLGSVKLPPTCYNVNQLHLATSSDGKLLKLLAIDRFLVFVWLHLPVSSASRGSDWSLDTAIDMEEKLRSLFPDIADLLLEPVEFGDCDNRSDQVVLLEVCTQGCSDAFISFDLETKEVHMQERGFSLLEIDLPSRLQTMKIFS